MTSVVSKTLPHGKIPFATISDPKTRDAVMKLNENIISLKRQLSAVQEAVNELQRR